MKHVFRVICCALLFHSILFPPVFADAADAVSEAAITLSGWGDKSDEKAGEQKISAGISEAKPLPKTGTASSRSMFFLGLILLSVMFIAVFRRQRGEKNEKQDF
ncbi:MULTISPECIES: LPXTG cell wall anchor domain-containing protein [unclassified Enterococcus]|uniref:LPXTG cell wall anchor domain-containing protein n=1 Tax=unclassified Enterococcus TaxID=2608891 RepID=UPI003D2C1F64